MAGDPFKKAMRGDPLAIPARAYNAMIDAAVAHRMNQLTGLGRAGAGGPGEVLVENTLGSDRDRFNVMGISGITFDPGDSDALLLLLYVGLQTGHVLVH